MSPLSLFVTRGRKVAFKGEGGGVGHGEGGEIRRISMTEYARDRPSLFFLCHTFLYSFVYLKKIVCVISPCHNSYHLQYRITSYWKCNFPMTQSDRLLIGRSVGWSIGMVG